MINYLEKFNKLPKELKDLISRPDIVTAITQIEKKYSVILASVVVKIMIKDISFPKLVEHLVSELKITKDVAEKVKIDLTNSVFKEVLSYLNKKPVIEQVKVVEPVVKVKEVKKVITKVAPPVTISPVIEKKKIEVVDGLDAKIENIVKQVKVEFSSQIMVSRFKQILKTYLKGIRNKINTREALTKSFDVGGLGFDAKSADNILAIASSQIDSSKLEIKSPAKVKVPEDRMDFTGTARDTEYDLAASVKSKAQNSLIGTKKIAPPPPVVVKDGVKKVASNKEANNEIKDDFKKDIKNNVSDVVVVDSKTSVKDVLVTKAKKEIETIRPKKKAINNIPKASNGKVKMDDIRVIPKVFSPVDEIGFMSLKSFRNLNQDPMLRVDIILEKLETLKKADYSKKVAGINAWKKSPVYLLYAGVLKASLVEKKPTENVLKKNLKEDSNSLTKEEFEAIYTLNKKIDF